MHTCIEITLELSSYLRNNISWHEFPKVVFSMPLWFKDKFCNFRGVLMGPYNYGLSDQSLELMQLM